MTEYYDGTKLLSMSDINGDKPEIYMTTSNRSAGKTTYFNRLAVNRFLKTGSKFGLLYRYNYELSEVADKFFKDIGPIFFKDYTMKSERRMKGLFHELFINEINGDEDGWISCGYGLSLNSADQIKKYSHLLSDIDMIIFDEFQSETNNYCPLEVKKFISIHTSIARGRGHQVRYLPVYMISNPITLLNPYYVDMGISNRLRDDTKFLKGTGFVLEQGFVESASISQKASAFNRAFASNEYVSYSSEAVYLNDSMTFIEKLSGKSRYICTLRYMGNNYAVREFAELGLVYCDDKADDTFPLKISVTTEDHNINYVMLKANEMLLYNLRYFFERGVFRFKNLQCKDAIMTALSY